VLWPAAVSLATVEAISGIRGLPEAERPRERLLRLGREALSEVELVALVFGGDLDCAHTVVTALGGVAGMQRAVAAELCAVDGVGPARACQLIAALELGRRAARPRPPEGQPLVEPADAAAHFGELGDLELEELHVLALDAAHRPIVRFLAARGSLNVVHVTPREVLRRLVREGAAAAIIAHNHPSGDPKPSHDDRTLTLRLRAAGEVVGVAILDHLVIARGGYFSFAEAARKG
jgi:DNA repair protein RadC